MRITNGYQMLTHHRNMSTALKNLTNSNNKMSSGREFNKAWENVADATRAFRVRKQLSSDDYYMTNIRDTKGRLDSADDNLQTVNTILRTVQDRVEQALNGTYNEEDRMKIATEIESLQKEVVAISNARYADKYLFSGSGGPTAGAPFEMRTVTETYLEGGVQKTLSRQEVTYHGMDVNDLRKNEDTGKIEHKVSEGNTVIWKEIPYNQTNYVNIGLGYKVSEGTGTVSDLGVITRGVFEVKTTGGSNPIDLIINPTDKFEDVAKNIKKAIQDAYPGGSVAAPATLDVAFDKKLGQYTISGLDEPMTISPKSPQSNATSHALFGTDTGAAVGGINNGNTIDYSTPKKDLSTTIHPETAIAYTFSGAELFGVGKSKDGLSNNIMNFMGEVTAALKTDNIDQLGKQLNHISNVSNTLLVGLTEIGARSNFISDMNNILTNDVQLMQETQNALEGIDLAEEAIQNKNFEMAWMVTLQLGSKILPSSLFDFMR